MHAHYVNSHSGRLRPCRSVCECTSDLCRSVFPRASVSLSGISPIYAQLIFPVQLIYTLFVIIDIYW